MTVMTSAKKSQIQPTKPPKRILADLGAQVEAGHTYRNQDPASITAIMMNLGLPAEPPTVTRGTLAETAKGDSSFN